jgi:hypothetical protein
VLGRIGDGEWMHAGLYFAAGLFSLALLVFFFAQIYYIRAALEKLNGK